MSRLAIDGGSPVRETPYPRGRGIELVDGEEIAGVTKVLEAKALFRYAYGALGTSDGVEAGLRERFRVPHALAVSSGTAGLYTALLALGVCAGDEVIVPAVTFVATVNAVVAARAVPVFAEVDESLTLDPASVEANLTPRTRAVVPVHLDNVAADLDPLLEVARRAGISVLEDAAQAAGVTYRGVPVGGIGDAGVLSFQQGKNITCGEGGAVLTTDQSVYERAAQFHDQGGQFVTATGSREHTAGVPTLGMNLRMTELAAAVLDVQLGRLDNVVTSCREHARTIRTATTGLGLRWRRMPDADGEGGSLMYFVSSPKLADRHAAALRAEGIPAGRMYDGMPVYLNQAVVDRRTVWADGCPFHCAHHPTNHRYGPGLCPRSEDLFGRSVIIGVSPVMTARDCADVALALHKVTAQLGD
jgi:dTDP-4-amino-4,6-dideoxygalactose transaminase